MSVAKASSRRGLAFTVALAMLLALAIPFAGIAFADHNVDNAHDLNVELETDSNATGDSHTLVATPSADCYDGGDCEVDFEVESGPAVTFQNEDGVVVSRTSDDGDTETSPDATCTVFQNDADNPTTTDLDESTQCSITFTSSTAGTNVIRAWIDDDRINATFDGDPTEGQVEGTTPGDRSETDDTDVVTKSWFAALDTDAVLNCDPEEATNPSTGDGSSETYTCTLVDDQNDTNAANNTPLAGFVIDGENLTTGTNDPDDAGTATMGVTNTTADYNNLCTTNASGSCTFTISASEAQTGTAQLCFWVDADTDTAFNDTVAADGEECNDEGLADEAEGSGDTTDIVEKTWLARGAATTIDCSPESDQNIKGTSHTVTCVVTDAFGTPVQGAIVDFQVSGRNTAVGEDRTTDAQGVATFTYTDTTAALSAEGAADTIEGCLNDGDPAGCAGAAGTDIGATEDEVSKFWFTTLPTTDDVIIDMTTAGPGEGEGGAADCNNTDVAVDKAATNNSVPSTHQVCAQVLNTTDQPVAGQAVTFTLSGPGQFFDDADNDDVLDTGEKLLGTSVTVNADANGEAFADIYSEETGIATVSVTSGSATDSGTKQFTAAAGTERNIDCTPETATNVPGTDHVITCVVTDRFGNPVGGVTVTASESGPGRISSSNTSTTAVDTATTTSDGTVEFVVSSTVNELGTQSITAAITSNLAVGTNNDPCEAAAGQLISPETGAPVTSGASPAPAGNCADTVEKTWTPEPEPEPEPDPLTRGACSGFAPGSRTARSSGGFVIVGTPGDDVLDGSGGADLICGLGGNDIIAGRGAGDLITGNGGDDNIKGGGGKDNISGNRGNDSISGSRGNDAIKGNAGNDTLKGNAGIDSLSGGKGADSLQGGDGDDILKGGPGNDTLRGGDGDDLLDGGDGNDGCFGNAGNDKVKNCE